MIDLAAAHFAAKHPKSITVANRTLERGEQLAARFGANAITLNELPERLAQFDMIVTSTASSLPILGKGLLERAIKSRRHTPMFIVDLAVPRDVEPEAAELDDVFLYSVDDLANIVRTTCRSRRCADAGRGNDREQAGLLRWLDGRSVIPTLTALQGHHEVLRAAGC
jgi:glutamyl-tRNA reductase